MKSRNVIKPLLFAAACLVLPSIVALAAHPLIFNGVIKSITDTTVQLGGTTFTMLPNCKMSFDDGPATVVEITAAMAANPRLVGVIRRDAPESTNVVALVVKTKKPAAPTPAPTKPAPVTDSAPAPSPAE